MNSLSIYISINEDPISSLNLSIFSVSLLISPATSASYDTSAEAGNLPSSALVSYVIRKSITLAPSK